MAYGNEIRLSRGAVTVRPLAEGDAPLLLKWMTDPRVLEWYEGRDAQFTPERVREDFYSDEPLGRRCIVEYERKAVGYIQIYRLDREMCREYGYPHPDWVSFGIDQFIGEPEYWGKGVGRSFISMIAEHLTQRENAQSVILDPHANNPRALRCYKACGFRKIKFLPAHELHEGVWEDCWLMEYRPKKP